MNKKILIVEDDTFIYKMYETKLHQLSYKSRIAENGEDALKIARDWKPDLILLDLIMPMLDGFEVLKKLKADVDLKNIPVIILSNLGQRANIEKGLELGADDYIIKMKFTPTEVVKKIEECFANRS